MFILSCRVCAVEFEAKSKRRFYCTQRCKDKGKPSASRLSCFVCEKPMTKSRTSKPQGEAAHNACRVGHGTVGEYAKGCRCRPCKDAQNASIREYNAKVRARDGASATAQLARSKRGVDPTLRVLCFICDLPLALVRSEPARYPMHKKCRESAPAWVQDQRDNPRRALFKGLVDKAAAGTSGGKRVWTSGSCAWCGEHFTKAQAKWCSAKCKDSSRFALKSVSAFKISPRARLSVYERDGWVCQLCGMPVDGSLHYLDSWAASLDHIIPQSHQIIPDHSPIALRLAHRWCNSARGDGSNMDEAELVERARILLGETGALV